MERLNVLGVGVSAVNLKDTVDIIEDCVARNEKTYVCVANVHLVSETLSNPALGRIMNRAGLVTPDGMPLVWLLRLAGFAGVDRVYGPDLMLALMDAGRCRGRRHFLYGTTPEKLARLQINLERRFGGLSIVGAIAPPFRPLSRDEDDAVVDTINRSGAEIVWVGLGAPKQEQWMADHTARLDAKVLIGVGAAFDFHAGAVRQAPRILQRAGLEWAFRLVAEPRRLWRRYLRSNPRFLAGLLAQKTGLRRFELER